MIFDNIHILLTFLGNDLREGHLREQTVGKEYIVKNSVQIRLQLLNGLKSSSNQVTVQILRTCPSIEDIVATDSDIRAVLKCGDLVLFTGYLSTNYSWTVTDSGKQALNITLEDVGTRLFGKNYLRSGSMLFKCKADIALRSICASAGVTVSPSCSRIQDEIIKVIESGKSCRDILSQMLYELGYVYYFNNLGELKVFQIDCSTTENAILIDREKLFTLSGKAITVSKSVRQYKSAKVTLKSVGEVHDFLVYRNTTGQDSSHEFCYMELEKDNYFDGLEIYTREEWAAETSDELRVPARIEACNAESRTDVVGSGKIISVSDIQVEFETDGNISCSISAPGGPYLEILAHNQGTSAKHINRMDVYGTVLYEKETIIVRTSDGTVDSLSSDNLLEETLS